MKRITTLQISNLKDVLDKNWSSKDFGYKSWNNVLLKELLLNPKVYTSKNEYGTTLLHHIAYNIPFDYIKNMREAYNVEDAEGRTPLYWAINSTPIFIKDLPTKIKSLFETKYPNREQVTYLMAKEIRVIPNSIRFIIED